MARLVPATCPGCGAALEIDPGARETSCGYCGKTALIARKPAPPTPHAPPTIVVSRQRGGKTLVFVLAGAIFAIGVAMAVGVALVTTTVSTAATNTPTNAAQDDTLDRGTRLAQANTPGQAPREAHDPHAECICRTDLDGDGTKETSVQIATRVHYFEGDELLTTYWADISGQESWLLPLDGRTAPAITSTSHFRKMYLACRGPIMALAAEDRITGWNLVERKAAWTTPLGGDYVSNMDVPAKEEGQFTTQCTRLDSETPEVLEITTHHGPVYIRLADGVAQMSPGVP